MPRKPFTLPDQPAQAPAVTPAVAQAAAERHLTITDYLRLLAGPVVRVGATAGGATLGSLVATPGAGTIAGGALGGAAGEALAEKIEGSDLKDINLKRVLLSGAMGAIPGSWMVKGGKPLVSAALGAGIAGVGTAGNKLAEGETPEKALNPLEWGGMDYLGLGAGALTGGLFGKYTKPHGGGPKGPTLTAEQALEKAGGHVNPETGKKVWPTPLKREPVPSGPQQEEMANTVAQVMKDKAKPLIKAKVGEVKKSFGQGVSDTTPSSTTPTQPTGVLKIHEAPGSAVPDPTFAEGSDIGPGTAFPTAPGDEGVSDATRIALARPANKRMAQTRTNQARTAANQAARAEAGAELADTRVTAGTDARVREAANAKAADKFVAKDSVQTAKNLDANATAQDAIAQQATIDAFKRGENIESSVGPVVETTEGVGPNGEPQSQRKFYKEKVEDTGDGGSPTGGSTPTGPAPDPWGPLKTKSFNLKKDALESIRKAGINPADGDVFKDANGRWRPYKFSEGKPAPELPIDLNNPDKPIPPDVPPTPPKTPKGGGGATPTSSTNPTIPYEARRVQGNKRDADLIAKLYGGSVKQTGPRRYEVQFPDEVPTTSPTEQVSSVEPNPVTAEVPHVPVETTPKPETNFGPAPADSVRTDEPTPRTPSIEERALNGDGEYSRWLGVTNMGPNWRYPAEDLAERARLRAKIDAFKASEGAKVTTPPEVPSDSVVPEGFKASDEDLNFPTQDFPPTDLPPTPPEPVPVEPTPKPKGGLTGAASVPAPFPESTPFTEQVRNEAFDRVANKLGMSQDVVGNTPGSVPTEPRFAGVRDSNTDLGGGAPPTDVVPQAPVQAPVEPTLPVNEFAAKLSAEGEKPIAEVPFSLDKQADLGPKVETPDMFGGNEPPSKADAKSKLSPAAKLKAMLDAKAEPTPAAPIRAFPENMTPLDQAGEEYGLMKGLKKAGLASEEGRAAAGKKAGQLNREDISASAAAEKKAQIEAVKQEIADPNTDDLTKSMLKRWLSEHGAANPMLMARAATGLGGAAIGATQTPDDPLKGGLLGFGAGVLAPSAAMALLKGVQSNPNATGAEVASVGQKIKDTLITGARMIPEWQRFSLLSDFPNLPINVFVGPWGSATMGALEYALKQDPRGKRALLSLLNLKKFGKEWGASLGEAKYRIADANESFRVAGGNEGTMGTAGPAWFGRMTSTPGQWMTAGDVAARNFLTDAGFTVDEARRMTLTSDPKTAFGRAIANFKKTKTEGIKGVEGSGKRSIIKDMMLPFYRTGVNQFEQGMERTPFVGFLAQWAKDVPDDVRTTLTQQGLGTVMEGGAFMAGMNMPNTMDPTDPNYPTYRAMKKFMNEVTGQYGTGVSLAFAAGQAYAKTGELGSIPGALAQKAVSGDIPMPTPQPIQEAGKVATRIAKGDAESDPIKLINGFGLVPGFVNPTTTKSGRPVHPFTIWSLMDQLGKTDESEQPPSTRPDGRPTFVLPQR